MTYRRMTQIGVGGVVILALASVALGQWSGRGFGRSRFPPRFKPAGHLDRGFTFCRLMYTSDRRDPSGRGWSTDYPFADINFMVRFLGADPRPVSILIVKATPIIGWCRSRMIRSLVARS